MRNPFLGFYSYEISIAIIERHGTLGKIVIPSWQ
jgi:hypothetical protein